MSKETTEKPDAGRAPWWRSIGPALITACVVFGPGSLVISANVGATYGFNLLWLVAEDAISEADLNEAGVTLRQLAERKTEEFFTRRGFASAAAFLKQYQHLSGIVLRQPGEIVIWLNALARHKTPPEIVNAIRRLA